MQLQANKSRVLLEPSSHRLGSYICFAVYNLQYKDQEMKSRSHFTFKKGYSQIYNIKPSNPARQTIYKSRRPISHLDLFTIDHDFEDRHLPCHPQSTRQVNSQMNHLGQHNFFPKNNTNTRMKTHNDENQDGIPTSRLPLKIRNFYKKSVSGVEHFPQTVKTDYDAAKKRKEEFENKQQPIYNKIVQKLSDKQKLIKELKKIASIQIRTRDKKNQKGAVKGLQTKEEIPPSSTITSSLKQKDSNIAEKFQFGYSNPKNPEENKDESIKKAAVYFTPQIDKNSENQLYRHTTSSTYILRYAELAKKQHSPQIFKKKKKNLSNLEEPTYARDRPSTSINFLPKNRQLVLENKSKLSQFRILKELGQGKFGSVFAAIHKASRSLYAIKKIKKSTIQSHLMIQQLTVQIKIQTYCNHQNIVKLYDFFDDKDHLYLVLQYMTGGTLFDQLKKTNSLKQIQTSAIVKQVAQAVKYLHDSGIAHRDIKPQNIVLTSGVAKLCDFGWAAICNQRRRTYCGTFDYAAPQILQGSQYDMSVDLWCLGVLTYELLVGKAPFYHISRKQTIKKIKDVNSNAPDFPSYISHNATDFIKKLLKKKPQERINADSILLHPFLNSKGIQ